MRIELDETAARNADAEAGSRIEKTGSYVGIFTKARLIQANSGAKGIEFEFSDLDSGKTADFLTIYTHKADGTPLFGWNLINSLMICLKLRAINSAPTTVEMWDNVAKQRVPTQAECYQGLMNKPVGVVLQMEEYFTKSGELRKRPVILRFFEANTLMMASEILDKKAKPEALDKFLATLLPVRKAKSNTQNQQQTQPAAPNIDDDIPF